MENVLFLARLQFALTTVYHFLFVPLTLGLSVLVAILQTKYYKTGDEAYKKLTKYFGGLFLINFSVGVATGIVQEFQFGMNWSGYSRFVGDIFGAPLAIEALAAFFMESTFLGIWIFGWDRLSKKAHLASIWLVAFGSNLSALWILIANSWMQDPVGFQINNGRAEMTSFFALVSNGHVWLQFPHVVLSGFSTAAFFVLAISAYNLLKQKKDAAIFKHAIRIAAIFGAVSLLLTIFIGDLQGKELVEKQPMKMAAAEALWDSEDNAALSLFAIIDEDTRTNKVNIAIPGALSFLSYNNFTQRVEGINEVEKQFISEFGEGDYIPPVTLTFWSFRAMVYSGGLMLLLAILALIFTLNKTIDQKKWFLKAMLWALPLPYIANSFGWILTEVGRYPWIVYKVLQVKDAVSQAVGPVSLSLSIAGFVVVYGLLAAVAVVLAVRYIKDGGHADHDGHGKESEAKLWN